MFWKKKFKEIDSRLRVIDNDIFAEKESRKFDVSSLVSKQKKLETLDDATRENLTNLSNQAKARDKAINSGNKALFKGQAEYNKANNELIEGLLDQIGTQEKQIKALIDSHPNKEMYANQLKNQK